MATTPLFIGGTNFWSSATPLKLFQDGSLLYVVLQDSAKMGIILRTAEDLFSDTIARESRNFDVIINGNFYDVTFSGKVDAAFGSDPVEAKETAPIGLLVNNFKIIGGRSAAQLFYVANTPGPLYYSFDFGECPSGYPVNAAIGGVGPLIINGLKYGNGNLYKPGTSPGAPSSGSPPPQYQANLIQRNNDTYVSAADRPLSTGKTVIAHSSNKRMLLILVQSHGSSGVSMDDLRDKLFGVGIDNAVFLDGSDSSMLTFMSVAYVKQGPNKNETNTVGVGFKRHGGPNIF